MRSVAETEPPEPVAESIDFVGHRVDEFLLGGQSRLRVSKLEGRGDEGETYYFV